jgi:hypothetical protein
MDAAALLAYFQRVVVVSLKRTPNRLQAFRERLAACDWPFIQPEVFDAIDGRVCLHPPWFGDARMNGAWGCVLPGNRVQGRVLCASKAWYSGEAVEIVTRSGETATLTINHPVLTEHGFVRAGQLHQGKNLLRYCGHIKRPLADNHIQHGPTVIEKVFRSIAEQGVAADRKRSTSIDFYSDGKFIQGDIEVVYPSGPLLDARQTRSQQGPVDNVFLGRHRDFHRLLSHFSAPRLHPNSRTLALSSRRRSPPYLLSLETISQSDARPSQNATYTYTPRESRRTDATGTISNSTRQRIYRFSGLIPRYNLSLAIASEISAISQPCRHSLLPSWNASQVQPSRKCRVGNTDFTRQSISRLPSNISASDFWPPYRECLRLGSGVQLDTRFKEFAFDNPIAEAALASDLRNRFPSDVTLDPIVSVRRFHFVGHVYDLETETGYFIASKRSDTDKSGIIISNCYRSHLNIIEKSVNDGVNRLLILEDDAAPVPDFAAKVARFLEALPADAELTYLGGQVNHYTGHPPKQVNSEVIRPWSVNRLHAFFLSVPGMKKFYRHVTAHNWQPHHHIDHHIEQLSRSGGIVTYAPTNWMVDQAQGFSTIMGQHLRKRTFTRAGRQLPMVVAVLGPYRSGTSAVAGAMHKLGISMGNQFFQGGQAASPKGCFEAKALYDLCLACYPEPKFNEGKPYTARVQLLRQWLNGRGNGGAVIGAKHPKLCLMIPEMLEAWPECRFVAVDRPIEKSIDSLRKLRWWQPPQTAEGLTTRLADTRNRDLAKVPAERVLRLDFDRFMAAPREHLEALATFAEIEPTPEQYDKAIAHLDKTLNHHPEDVPEIASPPSPDERTAPQEPSEAQQPIAPPENLHTNWANTVFDTQSA